MKINVVLAASAAMLTGCAVLAISKVPVTNWGNMLVDPKGMTLYTFDRDPRGKSACTAQCAADWPPLAADTDARPAGEYAVIVRDDGRRQWAYKGKPLYLWTRDRSPGDRTGDGVNNVWRVAKP